MLPNGYDYMQMEYMPKIVDDLPTRIDTGVQGLNDILSGGLPAGQMYLLEGTPGTGKTTIALQFIRTGILAGDFRSLHHAFGIKKGA